MKKIVIIGSGGLAAEITQYVNEKSGYFKDISIKGYIDHASSVDKFWSHYNLDKPVLNDIENYNITEEEYFVIGMADSKYRRFVINKIIGKGGKFINLIHPTAMVDKNNTIGTGNFVGPYCLISPNVKIGDFNVILAQSIIGHDCIIGTNNVISSSILCGYVKVGDDNFFGIRSTVIPHISIGNRNKIQAGMTVDANLTDDSIIFHKFKEKILVIPKDNNNEHIEQV